MRQPGTLEAVRARDARVEARDDANKDIQDLMVGFLSGAAQKIETQQGKKRACPLPRRRRRSWQDPLTDVNATDANEHSTKVRQGLQEFIYAFLDPALEFDDVANALVRGS